MKLILSWLCVFSLQAFSTMIKKIKREPEKLSAMGGVAAKFNWRQSVTKEVKTWAIHFSNME